MQLAVTPVACGPEYEVLSTPTDDKGNTGAGGTAQAQGGSAGEEGGTVGSGGTTTSGGESGETSTGGITTGGSTGGSGIAGAGASGGFAGASCGGHADCPELQTCEFSVCAPCADSAIDCSQPCPAQQIRVATIRNGCAICECAPPSECTKDGDCAMGEICYRGAQCEDGCGDSLECCFGNHCGVPGCSGPPPSCSLAGCEGGNVCQPTCIEATCFCNGMVWLCSDTGMGTGGSSGTGAGGTGAIGGNDCQGQCVAP
jgi:hypothetical protein